MVRGVFVFICFLREVGCRSAYDCLLRAFSMYSCVFG